MLATGTDAPARQDRRERDGCAPAFRFPAPSPALSVLRPASIPKSVNLYECAFFDKGGFSGPDRHDLVNGLLTLNGMGVLGDEALIAVADGSLNDLMVWGYVEAGFNSVVEDCRLFTGHLLSPLIADVLPLKALAGYWLDWHEQNADVIPVEALNEIVQMPNIGTGSQASEAFCEQLPALFSRNQDRIVNHLNGLCDNPGNALANELPLTFLTEPCDASCAPLAVGCGEMLGLNYAVSSVDFSPAYWRAMVHGLRLIGSCLRPMMTPDEMIDVSPAQMEEEADDVKAVLALLEERGQDNNDEEAVEAAIGEIESFMVECFGSFQYALESYETTQDVKARWLAEEDVLSVKAFVSLVADLPSPSSDLDQIGAEWLATVVRAMPASQGDSALSRIRGLAHCEGSLDMMLPVFFEDDSAFAEVSIQPAFEVFMSDAEESFWSLGWDISPALLEEFAQGIRAGNELLSDLDDRIAC